MTLKKKTKDGAEITLYVVIGIIGCPIFVPFLCFVLWHHEREKRPGGRLAILASDNRRRKLAEDVREEKEKNRPRNLPPTRRELSVERESSVERELSVERGRRRPRMIFRRLRAMGKKNVDSPILRLPAELRRQILLEVLGQGVIHLAQGRGRLIHTRCKKDDLQSFPHNFNDQSYDIERRCIPLCQPCAQRPRFGYQWTVLEDVACKTLHPPRSESCLGVLRTCRQLYREGINMLYSTNVFDANDAETVLFLAQTIRPQRLKAIRHLQILTKDPWPYLDLTGKRLQHQENLQAMNDAPLWVECCKLIGSQMTGLQSLTVQIGVYVNRDPYDQHTRARHVDERWPYRRALYVTMLGAIRDSGIKGLKSFRLEIEKEKPQVVEDLQQGLRDVVCA